MQVYTVSQVDQDVMALQHMGEVLIYVSQSQASSELAVK